MTGVDGKHEHEVESPSFFNTAEVRKKCVWLCFGVPKLFVLLCVHTIPFSSFIELHFTARIFLPSLKLNI